MAALAPALPYIRVAATVFSFVGGMQQGAAAEAQAEYQNQLYAQQAEYNRQVAERNALIIKDQAAYDAARLKSQAKQEQAAGQREFIQRQRRKRLAQSNLLAGAASSGAGALDPTILNLFGQIEEQGNYNALSALYEGDSAATLLRNQAALRLYEGETGSEMTVYQGNVGAQILESKGRVASQKSLSQASGFRTGSFVGLAASGGDLLSKYAPQPTSSYNPAVSPPPRKPQTTYG